MSVSKSSRHLYLKVIDEIERNIENNIYKRSEKLPPEDELSKELGVSRATLREALRVLEEEKVVSRKHGIGTFVNPKPVYSSGIEVLNSITYMIQQSGKKPSSDYVSIEVLKSTKKDQQKFNITLNDEIIKIKRVRYADEDPIVYCIDIFPKFLVSESNIKKENSIFNLLEQYANKKITYAKTDIEPVICEEKVSKKLQCEVGRPLLKLKQMHYTEKNEPVLFSSNYFQSDLFNFHILRKRYH